MERVWEGRACGGGGGCGDMFFLFSFFVWEGGLDGKFDVGRGEEFDVEVENARFGFIFFYDLEGVLF